MNESSITGESLPVVKTVGDLVLAGTRNLSGQIRVTVALEQSESSLAKVIAGVSAASEQQMEGTEVLNVVMKHFVFGVVCLAATVFTATIWRNQSGFLIETLVAASEKAATVLAAACPCGIGLATPSAAMAGIGAPATAQTLSASAALTIGQTLRTHEEF